ncbi:MAG: HAD-IC family P-type ATPase, partial [Patescibacteria group bacterium]|nr:HAD-IC family P-type ATPase [Patescibacteria group bacterium]
MENKKKFNLIKSFRIPLIVALGIVFYWVLIFFGLPSVALVVILASIVLGSFGLFKEAFEDLLANQFALDYIAILAIAVSLVTKEFFVGSIIALMLSTGRTLEEYGANRAKQSLSLLTDRIPSEVVIEENGEQKKRRADSIKIGQTIIIRKGEVVALDGILLSKSGSFDESSLTGEPYPVDKFEKDTIRSGTINVGDIAKIQVTKEEKNSTYKKIISMVDRAQKEKPPLVRLADKYSVIFTIITFVIATFAYFYSHSLEGVLAVLVVATPCPLILATPIALLGGVNAFAKKRIIVKNL